MAFSHDSSDFAHEKFSAFVIQVIEGDHTVTNNIDRLNDRTAIFDRRVHLTFGVLVDESGEADFFALLHDRIITRLAEKCSKKVYFAVLALLGRHKRKTTGVADDAKIEKRKQLGTNQCFDSRRSRNGYGCQYWNAPDG